MLLSEIIEYLLYSSGSYISGNLQCIGIDPRKFLNSIIIHELKVYQRFRPLTFRFSRRASLAPFGRYAVFFSNEDSDGTHDGSADAGNVFNSRVGEFNRCPPMVPTWISSVIPTYGTGSAAFLFGALGGFGGFGSSGALEAMNGLGGVGGSDDSGIGRTILHEPHTFLWEYEKDDNHGILYTTIGSNRLDITAHYGYPIIDMIDSDGVFVDAELKYIDEGRDETFLEMVLGRFLITLGRSRRAFTLNNAPINFDSAELVSEGQSLVDTARLRLNETSNWYDSLGT